VAGARSWSARVSLARSSAGRVTPSGAGFTEYDHVIQALAAQRADHALDIGSLPRRPRRRFFGAHRLHLLHKVRPEDLIAIT